MTLYVETNFLLELAYLQPEHAACEQILASAERGEIQFAIPALCLLEARESLEQQRRRRQEFYQQLRGQLRELARLEPHREIEKTSQPLAQALLTSNAEEVERLEKVLRRLHAASTCLPLTLEVAAQARSLEQLHDLAPFDAAVLSAVRHDLAHAGPGPHGFVTRNSNDFNGRLLHGELGALNCKLLFKFADAVGWIRHQLGSRPDPQAGP